MLAEFIHRLIFSSQTSDLIRHYVLAISPWYIKFVAFFDQWKSRHYVLSNLLCLSWVLLSVESGLSRHIVLDNPIRLIQLHFIIWPVKKEDTMCYLIYCVKVG